MTDTFNSKRRIQDKLKVHANFKCGKIVAYNDEIYYFEPDGYRCYLYLLPEDIGNHHLAKCTPLKHEVRALTRLQRYTFPSILKQRKIARRQNPIIVVLPSIPESCSSDDSDEFSESD